MTIDVEALKAKLPTLKDIQVYRGWSPEEPTYAAYGFNAHFTDRDDELQLLPSIDVHFIDCVVGDQAKVLTDEIAAYIEVALYRESVK